LTTVFKSALTAGRFWNLSDRSRHYTGHWKILEIGLERQTSVAYVTPATHNGQAGAGFQVLRHKFPDGL